MAATVVSLPLPQPLENTMAVDSNPAEARKRRREILSSQRGITASPSDVSPDVSASASNVTLLESSNNSNKRRRVSNDFPPVVSPSGSIKKVLTATADDDAANTSTKKKKPQMKYDPDVPMTKEEAAVWRREQRRKRNRESAAASRQRQRDRIVELEAEVEEWKAKFDQAMKRIQELETGNGTINSAMPATQQEHQVEEEQVIAENINSSALSPEDLVEEVFKDTSIVVSPSHSPRSISPAGTSVIDYSQIQVQARSSSLDANRIKEQEQEQQDQIVYHKEESQKPSKMISRPA